MVFTAENNKYIEKKKSFILVKLDLNKLKMRLMKKTGFYGIFCFKPLVSHNALFCAPAFVDLSIT